MILLVKKRCNFVKVISSIQIFDAPLNNYSIEKLPFSLQCTYKELKRLALIFQYFKINEQFCNDILIFCPLFKYFFPRRIALKYHFVFLSHQECQIQGSLKNKVDIILLFFDHPPTFLVTSYVPYMERNGKFQTTYPPTIVHVVFEWPLH